VRSPSSVIRRRRWLSTAGRTSDQPSGMPTSQNRQSAPPFHGHAELLQAISSPRGIRPGTTSRRPLRTQSQGLPLHHVDTGAPRGLRKVQGEFATRHTTGTPRSICATCTNHRRLHVRHGYRATTTRLKRLAASRLLFQKTTWFSKNIVHTTASCWASTGP
jgi:hypothetical protein